MMKPPGYYALLHANGMPFGDVVELIREEAELYWECDCTALEFGNDDEFGVDEHTCTAGEQALREYGSYDERHSGEEATV